MALTNWLTKAPLTINKARVPAIATNLPVLLVYANFPASITGEIGGCLSDGRDIRFSTDADGNTELPREIIQIDKATNILTVYVKIPSIETATDTTIYVFWNNSSADEPGKGSASESKLVWSDYYGAFHFQGTTNSWKGVIDSSGSWSNMTPIGTPLIVDGFASGTKAAHLSATFGLTLHEFMNFSGLTNDLMFWCNLDGTQTVGNIATGTNGVPLGWLAAGQFGAGWGLFATTTNAVPATGWHHIWIRNVAGVVTCYVDGVNKTQGGGTAQATNFNTFGMGSGTATWKVSEIRMTRGTNPPVNNGLTMYSNESNPSLFITPGTPIVSSASNVLTLSGLQTGSDVKIYNVSTGAYLAGTDSSTTAFEWPFSHTGDYDVNIYIQKLGYEYVYYQNFTVTANDISIPVQQTIDRYKI